MPCKYCNEMFETSVGMERHARQKTFCEKARQQVEQARSQAPLLNPKARKAAATEARAVNADALALQRMLDAAIDKKVKSTAHQVELPVLRAGKKPRLCKDGSEDGRSQNRGRTERYMHSYEVRANRIHDFESWATDNHPGGPDSFGSVAAYVREQKLDSKFNKYLSKGGGGWRGAAKHAEIMHHASLQLKDLG